jgi:hypothetical protein
MSTCQSENKAQRDADNAAEQTRQVAVAAASTQAAVIAAEITLYRAAVAAAKANSCSTDVYEAALRSLAVWS